jgi:hypothetical protein
MNDYLGWLCTSLILFAFYLNAIKNDLSLYIWIIGDIGWIIYDYNINNFSHATLSFSIIVLNVYGIYYSKKVKNEN